MANNEFPQIHKPQEKNSQSPNFYKYTNHKKQNGEQRISTNTQTTRKKFAITEFLQIHIPPQYFKFANHEITLFCEPKYYTNNLFMNNGIFCALRLFCGPTVNM
jgi:hypothetical protein